jgi:hypothetical protein
MPIYLTAEEKLSRARANNILVDEQDMWLLEEYTWHIAHKGYARTNVAGGTARLHNAIMGCPIWEGEEIDHINRNPADNRRSNLRWTSPTGNALNRSFPLSNSGARNVYLMGSKYQVQIRRSGVLHLLGGFDTLDEAVDTRDAWLATNSG